MQPPPGLNGLCGKPHNGWVKMRSSLTNRHCLNQVFEIGKHGRVGWSTGCCARFWRGRHLGCDLQHLCPRGNSGYYNVQENPIPGIDWAFECVLDAQGLALYNLDSTPILATTYTQGEWVSFTHHIDTDTDEMQLFIDGVFAGAFPLMASALEASTSTLLVTAPQNPRITSTTSR